MWSWLDPGHIDNAPCVSALRRGGRATAHKCGPAMDRPSWGTPLNPYGGHLAKGEGEGGEHQNVDGGAHGAQDPEVRLGNGGQGGGGQCVRGCGRGAGPEGGRD